MPQNGGISHATAYGHNRVRAAGDKVGDFARNAFNSGQQGPKWIWNALPLLLGVGMALAFGLDVFQMFENNATAQWPVAC